jgi:hypothetical protein
LTSGFAKALVSTFSLSVIAIAARKPSSFATATPAPPLGAMITESRSMPTRSTFSAPPSSAIASLYSPG